MSDNGKNTIFWGAYVQTEKSWRRDPLVVNYPVQQGLDYLRPYTFCPLLHIFFVLYKYKYI